MDEFAKGRLALFFEKLTAAFPGRLLFLGLQGSYRRGEQTPESDLDIVTILDRAEYADLAKYRAMLKELPGTPQPCGFLCGLAELKNWPRYDLFGLYYDTEPFYGSLSDFIDPPGLADALESVRVGAANLLHEATHRSIYGRLTPEIGLSCLKSAKFLVIAREFLRTGVYEARLSVLETQCTGGSRRIITALREQSAPEDWAELIFDFCGECLRDAALD